MTKLEEEVIARRILDDTLRGIPVSKADVRDMADSLLKDRGGKPVGKNWVDNFIKRIPELRTRWSRPYDRQRAACEDPAIIQPWYTLVQSMKAKYGIVDEDMYNFDKSGFLMGKILSQLVVLTAIVFKPKQGPFVSASIPLPDFAAGIVVITQGR
jgi:hypothetical protein